VDAAHPAERRIDVESDVARILDAPREVTGHALVETEKGTVRGILAPVLDEYEVPFRVHHGHTSTTTAHDTADEAGATPQPLVILYVGDWDPSGLHMSEVDLPTRLAKYGAPESLTFRRVALIADDQADLPWFPAKRTDTRYPWCVREYGTRCWELDALDPRVLRNRVAAAIVAEIEPAAWARRARAEAVERESIHDVLTEWRRRISA
jgi:hypothetical protein